MIGHTPYDRAHHSHTPPVVELPSLTTHALVGRHARQQVSSGAELEVDDAIIRAPCTSAGFQRC